MELVQAAPGDRVLLLYPPGLDYIAAFFGCLYAGVIAVPAYPPHLNRPDPRLHAIVVGWLPLYHDMGLIGLMLQSLYIGAPYYLMSPVAFLQNPFAWLSAISRYRATASCGPNFAYDLCVRKVTPEQRAQG